MVILDDRMVAAEVVIGVEEEDEEETEEEVAGEENSEEAKTEAEDMPEQEVEEERQQLEEVPEQEEKPEADAEAEEGPQLPQELQQQDPVLRPASAQDPLAGLERLQLEISAGNAQDSRALWRLKRRILRRWISYLDHRRAIIKHIPGFWAQAVSFLVLVGDGGGCCAGGLGSESRVPQGDGPQEESWAVVPGPGLVWSGIQCKALDWGGCGGWGDLGTWTCFLYVSASVGLQAALKHYLWT